MHVTCTSMSVVGQLLNFSPFAGAAGVAAAIREQVWTRVSAMRIWPER